MGNTELIRQNVQTLTVEEGKAALAASLDEAERLFKDADKATTAAILKLDEIRTSGLYTFAYDSWNNCIHAFVEERGIGRSSTLKWLKFVRLWTNGLGLPAEQLLALGDGVRTIEPLIEGDSKMVGGYSATTGEIQSVANGWDGILPEGETPADRIRSWIVENVITDGENPTAVVVRQRIRAEGVMKDVCAFGLCDVRDGKPTQILWVYEPVGKPYRDGTGITSMPPEVFREFCSRIKIANDWGI